MAAHINPAAVRSSPMDSKSRLTEVAAGMSGGIAVVLVGHPFDTTKTRLQVAPSGYFKGTRDCVQQTMRLEGIRGFYSGMSSPLLGQMFFRAASFASFHASLDYLNSLSPSTRDATPSTSCATNLLAAGGITGFVISFIETPIDVVKTKLQTQIFSAKLSSSSPAGQSAQMPFSSFRTCVSYIVRSHGPHALYQGLSATMIRNVPANALFFPVNEICKQSLLKFKRQSTNADMDLILPERLLCGATAGMCYWVLTYPLDAIKGKMQGAPFESRSTWAGTAMTILKEHGPAGFLRGIVPCAARSIPACSALFTTMDLVKLTLSAST